MVTLKEANQAKLKQILLETAQLRSEVRRAAPKQVTVQEGTCAGPWMTTPLNSFSPPFRIKQSEHTNT